ncbi:GNAT family N-acetyltransferase [Pendulispora albinea]|uniref:GNAT family N-acetyltransferase n=1 Tax=Pendulispora albinea TaxID=2741071 RepID=A0ABZ2M5P4_9BACT
MTRWELGPVPPVSTGAARAWSLARAESHDRGALITLLGAQFLEHDIRLTPEQLAVSVDGVLSDPTRGLFIVARVGGNTEPPSERPPAPYPGAPVPPAPSSPSSTIVVGIAFLSFMWTLEHGGVSAWLDVLYVVPAHRSQGIGRALLTSALEASQQRGCVAVDLEIEASHARAANLYLRLGFRPHARTRWVKPLKGNMF